MKELKTTKKTRILALVLVCCMVISFMPEVTLASVEQNTVATGSEEQTADGGIGVGLGAVLAAAGDMAEGAADLMRIVARQIVATVFLGEVDSAADTEEETEEETVSEAISLLSSSDVQSGTCGENLTWTFDRKTGVLTISGTGDMDDYGSIYASLCYSFYSYVTSIVIEEGVTSIGDYAFRATHITELSIPDSVVSIGAHAFQQCMSLTSVSIGAGVESIGECAFHRCYNISDGITVSEDNSCYASLDGVLYNKSMTELILYAGETTDSYTVPDGVEKIAPYAFYYDDFINIELPDSLLEIGEYAFYHCSSLTNIQFPEQLEKIGEDAFAYCDAITEFLLPDSLVSIDSLAFTHCEALETVSIGNGLSVIAGHNPFAGDYSLREITVSEDNSWFYTEDGVLFDKNKVLICYPTAKSSTSYTVPDGTTAIGAAAFGWFGITDYSMLESVVIPDSVVSIGDAAFWKCANLTNVDFGEGLKYIDCWAFNSTSLKSIELPDSLTGIGERAFLGNDFSSVIIGSKVQSIGVAAFGGCENLTSISVDSDNAWFCSADGVLFSKDMTILIEYPSAKSDSTYTVPSSVVEIVDYAFMNSNNLTSVTTTSNVTKIGYSAFLSCKSLERLTLPEGITLSIYGCSSYVGTTYIQAIDPVALSDCTISLATGSYTYDGVAKKPTVTVKNGSTTLKEGRDYSVSYSDNKNAGTAKVTIMGISEYYTGTVTKTFTIQKASQTVAASLSQTEIAVGSSATITATGTGNISYSSSDTGVATVSSSGKVTAKAAGTAKITIKAAGNSNYKSASTTLTVTVTSTASTDGVSLSSLTYSFSNSRSAYGYSSSYKIPLARYKLFYSDQLASTYYSSADAWGGSCYGMSTTSSMFNTSDSTLTVSSFNSSATKVSDLGVSNKNSTLSMTVTQLIEAMQVSQFSYSLASERTSTNGDLDELVSIVKGVSSGGTMPVICVFYKTNTGTGGHALLGYKVEKKSSSMSYLYVYDCNYPNTERYITLYTNSSGAYTGYYYKINDTYNCGSNYSGSSIKYNTYAAYQEVWAGRNGASVSSVNQLLVQSDSFEIQDADGTIVAVMEDGEFTSWSEEVYQLELVDMDDLNGTLVYMPLESYTVCDTGGDESTEFELTMVNDSQSVSVTTQADSVSFLVDDEQAVSLAQIDGENGELYEVTVSSSLEDYSSDQETVTYSGKCEDDIITIGTVSGEYVVVNYTGCGVAAEDAIINCTTDIISDTSGITDISSGYTMTISGSSFAYTGERIEPEVTVTDSSSNVLVNGKDYIVVYENNTEIGTATATAYGINNYTGTITVSFAIETGTQTITASAGSTSIAYGKTTTITVSTTGDGALSYSSSNTSVATVDSSGKVTAKGVGTATITVTAAATTNYTEATKTVKITVTRASQSLKVSSSSVTLAVKGTSTITVSGNKTTLSYSSSDTSVATVSSSGVITAKKVGTATITVTAAQTDQYAKATKTITVKVKPVTPTNVTVTNTSSGVKITWDKVTGATGYYVYRSTSKSGTYTKIATIKSGSTVTYTNKTSGDYKAANAKTYYYKVYAYAATGTSSASSVKSIRFITAGKVSSLTNASGGVTVKWSKVSGATGYYIYRNAGSGDYKKIATVTGASTVSYTNKTSGNYKVVNGTTYKYYVIPYYKSSSGTITKGSYSNTKTIIYLTAGKLSSVKNSSSKKMTVKWSKNSKATGYQIQYSTSSSFTSSKTKTVTISKAATVSRTIGSLTKGKTYYVRVRSYKKSGSSTYYSAWSSKKSVKISK